MPVSRPPEESDFVEPATVVATMASAVDRVRRMACSVFEGDAALFADSAAPDTQTS